MNIDFLNVYYPSVKDLSPETIKNARDRLETYLRGLFPELDTRVNSVFGDLNLTPHAYLLASLETAMGRFMSDLDLENVAAGVIYNCDFVRKYLHNFAIVDRDNLKSTGVVRLIFCVDKDYTIDRRTRYSFGGSTEFSLRLPYVGHLEIKSTNSVLPANQNTRRLVQLTDDRWACDIGVTGVMGDATISKGAIATTDLLVDDLETIMASVDFTSGIEDESLPSLAERTRKTFYAATLSTRSGARHFLLKDFPELHAVSPVITGDVEQIRGVASVLGIPDGRVDMYVKSNSFGQTDSQVVTLQFDPDDSKYKGKLAFINPPNLIDSITSSDSPDTDVGFKAGGVEILTRSSNFAKAPYLSAAYSTLETFFIAIDQPTPALSNTVIEGDQFHNFLITYRTDPIIPVVSDVVDTPDNKPIGVDLITRGFVVARLTSLKITYVKKAGVKMTLENARNEIYTYFKTLGYDSVYTNAKIIDSMYYAGAKDVVSIVPTGYIQWTVADKILPYNGTDPLENWDTAVTESRTAPIITISTTSDLIPSYQDPELGDVDLETFASVGKRNVCYILDYEDILFEEVLA